MKSSNVSEVFSEMEKLRVDADQGLARAQWRLGCYYFSGEGVEKDVKEGVRLYKLAADQGLAIAQWSLGGRYLRGIGVEKDVKEAVRLFKLAADQGLAIAQQNLGDCYFSGEGVAKDAVEAAKFYKLAADQGLSKAQYNLGTYHLNGVAKDSSLAILYFARAGEYGSAREVLNRKKLPLSFGHVVSVDPDSRNTPLSASEIIEIISASSIRERISNNRSSLIGDLVAVSESQLSSAELLKIYGTLTSVRGVNVVESKSCRTIADSWAKKLGQEIGIEGRELAEIVVTNRDAKTIQCQLPSGIGSRPEASTSPLHPDLVSGEDLFQVRNSQIMSRMYSSGISVCGQGQENRNFLVTANVGFLQEVAPSAARTAASYSPPELSASEIINPMLEGEVPSSTTIVEGSKPLRQKEAGQERK